MSRQLIVVGGANGVGKTTFALQYGQDHGIDYLSADDIADGMSNVAGGSLRIRAGKEFFGRLSEYLRNGRSLIVESTLSGVGLARQIRQFKAKHCLVQLVYLFLDDVSLCKRRIELRVKKGGHTVPPLEVERRYVRSTRNFRQVYLPLADRWQLLYNGFVRPVEVAFGEEGQMMVVDERLYQRYEEISR